MPRIFRSGHGRGARSASLKSIDSADARRFTKASREIAPFSHESVQTRLSNGQSVKVRSLAKPATLNVCRVEP